ncbi:Uncharacterised protein [uncultured archaeon]|nr:Uncharacterised protein [uncultured archaeon]
MEQINILSPETQALIIELEKVTQRLKNNLNKNSKQEKINGGSGYGKRTIRKTLQ